MRAVFLLVVLMSTPFNPLFAQWVESFQSNFASCVGVDNDTLFVGTDYSGVYRSSDVGGNWTQMNAGLSNTDIDCFAFIGTNVFVGTYGSGIYRSTNTGASWSYWTDANNSSTAYTEVTALAVIGPNLFAGTYGEGIFLSTDNGANWSQVDSGLSDTYVTSLAVEGTNIFAGTFAGGVCLSTDNGISWAQADSGITSWGVACLAVAGNNVYAGSGQGVFLSTNNGRLWTKVDSGLTNCNVQSLCVSGVAVFAGTDNGTFLSTDHGLFWTQVGLTNGTGIIWLAASKTTLFATKGGSVYSRQLSQMITGINENRSNLPYRFELNQNYPNPFNPLTVISYQLPSNVSVSLRVFDILGRQVETLVNERQSAGIYSVRFNAAKLPSGVYLYRLEAGPYHDTKKLLLLK